MMNAKRSSRINLTRYLFVAPAVVILLLTFSISKAEAVKKGFTTTIHTLSKAITSIRLSNNQPKITQVAHKQKKETLSQNNTALADTIYHGISKDGKTSMMVTSDKGIDSTCYVLDGAKTGRNDILNLDAGKIYSMDLMSADVAKQFVDFMLDKPQVLFVTTKDSEKGMYLKERIDKAVGHGVLAGSGNVSVSGKNDVAPVAPTAATTSYSYSNSSSDSAPKVATASGNVSSSVVYIAGKPTAAADGKPLTLKVKPATISGKPLTLVVSKDDAVAPEEVTTVDSNGVEHKNFLYKNKVYKINKKGADNIIYLNARGANDGGTTIDNFHSGVLYVIDGKEAKNMKGVLADDITSISVLRDETAIKKYGDKGKNGVIIVSTKKGQK